MTRWFTVGALFIVLSGCATNLVMRGRRLAEEGDYAAAISILNERLATHPDDPDAWRELALARYRNHEYDQAIQDLKGADQSDPRTHLIAGLLEEAGGRREGAIHSYTQAMLLGPNRATRHKLEARIDLLVKQSLAEFVQRSLRRESTLTADSIPPNTVAVVDFDGSQLPPDQAALALGLAEFTSADLAKVASLRVLERLKIDFLKAELNLSASGYMAAGDALRLGRLLGSRRLITANLLAAGENLRLTGAVIGTTAGEQTSMESLEQELSGLFQLQKDFVFALLDSLGVEFSKEERDQIRSVPTESYLAFLAYCVGLERLRAGDLPRAESKFAEAVKQDPEFAEAGSALEEVKRIERVKETGEVTPEDLATELARENESQEWWEAARLGAVSPGGPDATPEGSETSSAAKAPPGFGTRANVTVRGGLP